MKEEIILFILTYIFVLIIYETFIVRVAKKNRYNKDKKIPNVIGKSSKIAKDILTKLGVKVNLDGVGYVTEQSVSESTPITEGMEIILKLSPKFSEE